MTIDYTRCPRCGQTYNPAHAGASRAVPDRDIDICGPCCSDEAAGRGPVEVARWPLDSQE